QRFVAPDENADYPKEEYPDFRGKRGSRASSDASGAGRQHPAALESDTELIEPPRFPGGDDAAGANGSSRRSFRETLHDTMAGLWNRRSSSDNSDEAGARAP